MAKKPVVAQVWGKRTAEFLQTLQERPVQVLTTGGKLLQGALVGVDVYEILIRQPSGLEILLPKSNIVYLHAVDGGN